MKFTFIRIDIGMVSVYREPYLQLGVRASDVMEQFYRALQGPDRIPLRDLITSGGSSYAELKLTINTFGGAGRIDITPGALIVELKDMIREARPATDVVKEHLLLCEETAHKALTSLNVTERILRAGVWLACEGGRPATEAFLAEKGNAALQLDHGIYGNLKKEFTVRFHGLDVDKATKIGLALEVSSLEGADLFAEFDHTRYGSPSVTSSPKEQFQEAEKELMALLHHVGLEPEKIDAG
ncbi:MAG: hypothetical protein KJ587_17370 [Alphaproteobacteria bacterium]|nr:hypothetical protein [Alphaproteobacteria bacterium]